MFTPRILYLHSQLAPESSVERFADLLDPKTVGLTDKSQFYAPVRFNVQVCGGINAAAGAIRLDVPVHANPNWLQVMKSRFSGMCGVPNAASMDFKTITGKSISEFAPDDMSQVGKLNVFVNNKLLRLPEMPTVPVEFSVSKSDHIQKWFNEKVATVLPEVIASELSKCNSEHEINKAIEPNGAIQKTIEKTIRASLDGKSWTEFVRTHHMNSPSYMPKEFSADTLKVISSEMLHNVRQFVGAASNDIESYLAHIRSKKLSKDPDFAPVLGKVNNNTPKINGQKMYNKLMQDAISTPSLVHNVVDTLFTQPIGRGCRWDDDKPVVARTKTTGGGGRGGGGGGGGGGGKSGGVDGKVYAQMYANLRDNEKTFVQSIAVLLTEIAKSNQTPTVAALVQSMDELHTKLNTGVLSAKLTEALAYVYAYNQMTNGFVNAFSESEKKFVNAFAAHLIVILSNDPLKQFFILVRPHVPDVQKQKEAPAEYAAEKGTSNRGGVGAFLKNVTTTLVNFIPGAEKELDLSTDGSFYKPDATKQCSPKRAKEILVEYHQKLQKLINYKGGKLNPYNYSGDYFVKVDKKIVGTFAEDDLKKAVAERERLLMEAKNNKNDNYFNNQIYDVVTYYAAQFLYDITKVVDNDDKIKLFLQLVTNRHVEHRRGTFSIDYMATRDMTVAESQRAKAQSVAVLQQTQPQQVPENVPEEVPIPVPEEPEQGPAPVPEEEAPPVPEREEGDAVQSAKKEQGPAPEVPKQEPADEFQEANDGSVVSAEDALRIKNEVEALTSIVKVANYIVKNKGDLYKVAAALKWKPGSIAKVLVEDIRDLAKALGIPDNPNANKLRQLISDALENRFQINAHIEAHHPWNALIHHSLYPVNGTYPTYYNVLHTKQDMSKDAPYVGGDLNETYKYYHMFMGGAMLPPGKVMNKKRIESVAVAAPSPIVSIESKMRERLVPIAARPPLVHISQIKPAAVAPIKAKMGDRPPLVHSSKTVAPVRVAPVRARLVDVAPPKRVESEETSEVEKKLHYTQLPSVNDVFDD
jgi:hypothetical protein